MGYIEEAIAALKEVMSGSRGNMFEHLNRSTKGEIFVLKYLLSCDSAALPSELSEALHSSTARISALLGTLEKKEQIIREIDKSNRRNILVTITETGRRRVSAFELEMEKYLTQVFAEMGECDTREFVRLAKRFYALSHHIHMCQTTSGNDPAGG